MIDTTLFSNVQNLGCKFWSLCQYLFLVNRNVSIVLLLVNQNVCLFFFSLIVLLCKTNGLDCNELSFVIPSGSTLCVKEILFITHKDFLIHPVIVKNSLHPSSVTVLPQDQNKTLSFSVILQLFIREQIQPHNITHVPQQSPLLQSPSSFRWKQPQKIEKGVMRETGV